MNMQQSIMEYALVIKDFYIKLMRQKFLDLLHHVYLAIIDAKLALILINTVINLIFDLFYL